jgi:uncharacterized protein YndB with AHSA1/START domain
MPEADFAFAGRELATARRLVAAPAAVFAAFSDGTRLARWWGPAGFTNRFETFEFRTDGAWVFDMIGPDGRTYPNRSTFGAIVPDRRIEVRHVVAPLFTLFVSLEPDGDGTVVGWRQRFERAAECAALAGICVPSNEQNLDRLAVEVVRGA